MSEDTNIKTSIPGAVRGIRLSTGQHFTINLSGTATVFVIEVEDVLFRHKSAVYLPEAYDYDPKEGVDIEQERISGLDVLRTVFIRSKEYPDQKLLIAGHTDTTGEDKYNLKLSDKRGKSVLFILLGKRDEWAEICDKQHRDEDIQHILTWIARKYPEMGCDPQGIDGKIREKTRQATRNFQKNFEPHFGRKIRVDGEVGPETWGAFFEVYQRELAKMLEIEVAGLVEYQNALKWVDTSRQSVGCGENWPIEEPDQDKYRSRINRRVELLFFDPAELPRMECHSSTDTCDKTLCDVYGKDLYSKVHLPVHPHPHPQSKPTFYTPDKPGSSNYVKMHSIFAYVAYFKDSSVDVEHSKMFTFRNGKLYDSDTADDALIDCDREGWFYFSHRKDLMDAGPTGLFKQDRSKLPLIGPIRVPCGPRAEIRLDMWSQNDWVIVNGVPVDSARPAKIQMADWNESYTVGTWGVRTNGEAGFWIYGDNRKKEEQERWNRSTTLIDLINFAAGGSDPMWIGTLSELPSPKAKLLWIHNGPHGPRHVGSFNELSPKGHNQIFNSHHTYDRNLVSQLIALPKDDQPAASVDALPNPPSRYLLPGDNCWHDQKSTNFCGAFSFAAAMNYWKAFTNNPVAKDGTYYSGTIDMLLIPYGARTPQHIVDGAAKHNMHGRDNDAEEFANNGDRARALKLVKLWIKAGVPVLVLVEESYSVWDLHWKVIVGYDGNRFFITNSGADDELSISHQESGVVYDKAPVGNDVDSENALFNKWYSTGGDLVDAFSSVDTCTFIPIYPKESMFAGNEVK
ncbi:MAG TPA: hypothetical protein VN285_01590 [Candidatus Deferrimicrobium sp.]|nr:hypothetical protein [Candidatus Deferrimicrobium sp.]